MIKPPDIDQSNSETVSGRKQTRTETVFGYVLLAVILPVLTALLAWQLGMPIPTVHDEFSYLFMADTFAMGRLANPAHPLAEFFQTFHIIHYDGIYASKYFPGIGVQLLVGKILGHPMIGVWLTIGLFGASLLFVLRKFFNSRVAIMVSFLCSAQFMVLTYFGHSYWGGSLMAVSGVWILGGAVLAGRLQQVRYSWLAATGLIIGLLTRPFESFFFVVPLVLWQLWGLLRCVGGNGASKWSSKLAAPICVGVVAGVFALGAYNNCITGNWKMFPHTFYENIYTPHGVRFLWEQKAESDRNAFFRSLPQPFHQLKEHYLQKHQERMEHLVLSKAHAAVRVLQFQFPLSVFWMILVTFFFRTHYRNPLWLLCVFTGAIRLVPLLLSWSSTNPHYGAVWLFPFAILCAFGLQSSAVRHKNLVRAAWGVSFMVVMITYFASFNPNAHLKWKYWTSYYDRESQIRQQVVSFVSEAPSSDHLIIVKYGNQHSFLREWVYNHPEIDAQPIVWAHDLGEEKNARLREFYRDRTFWRVIVGDSNRAALERWSPINNSFEMVNWFQ